MRTHGTLVKWNEERGFGFVAVGQAGAEVFVHVSAFPRDGVRPQVGEIVSFELVPGDGGRQKAVKIQRTRAAGPAARPARQPSGREPLLSNRQGIASSLAVLLLLAGLGAVVVLMFRSEVSTPELAPMAAPLRAPDVSPPVSASAPASGFRCDGRTECSQMTSCAEAEFFLANCPGARMDGNHDGEPCEQQWCR
jgi:cold shock CspA family protein